MLSCLLAKLTKNTFINTYCLIRHKKTNNKILMQIRLITLAALPNHEILTQSPPPFRQWDNSRVSKETILQNLLSKRVFLTIVSTFNRLSSPIAKLVRLLTCYPKIYTVHAYASRSIARCANEVVVDNIV